MSKENAEVYLTNEDILILKKYFSQLYEKGGLSKNFDFDIDDGIISKIYIKLKNMSTIILNKKSEHIHSYNAENSHLSINGYRIFYCTKDGCNNSIVIAP